MQPITTLMYYCIKTAIVIMHTSSVKYTRADTQVSSIYKMKKTRVQEYMENKLAYMHEGD